MSTHDHSELMTIKEFANATRVSRQAIHALRRAGVITPREIGKRLFYTAQDSHAVKDARRATAATRAAKPTTYPRSKPSQTLKQREVIALELIAAAQVAQVLALGKFGALKEFDMEGFRCSAASLLQRLGIAINEGLT